MYTPSTGMRARCGQLLYAAMSLLLFSPLFLLLLLQRATKTAPNEAAAARQREQVLASALRAPMVAGYIRRASSVSWWVHDQLLRQLFGCGISTAMPFEDCGYKAGG